jgi:hypothetical protein
MSNQQQVVVYNYSIFDYCRNHDVRWRQEIDALRTSMPVCARTTPPSSSSSFSSFDCSLSPSLSSSSRTNSSSSGTAIGLVVSSRDLVLLILSFLDAPGLMHAAAVHSHWASSAQSDLLWGHLLKQTFAVTMDHLSLRNRDSDRDRKPQQHTKELYLLMESNFRKLTRQSAGFKTRPTVPAHLLSSPHP